MDTTQHQDNRGYEPPALIVIGSMADLTAGFSKPGSTYDGTCGCDEQSVPSR